MEIRKVSKEIVNNDYVKQVNGTLKQASGNYVRKVGSSAKATVNEALGTIEGGENVQDAIKVMETGQMPVSGALRTSKNALRTVGNGYRTYQKYRPISLEAKKKAAAITKKASKNVAKEITKKTSQETVKTVTKEGAKLAAKELAKAGTTVATEAVGTGLGGVGGFFVGTAVGIGVGDVVGIGMDSVDHEAHKSSVIRKVAMANMKADGKYENNNSLSSGIKDFTLSEIKHRIKFELTLLKYRLLISFVNPLSAIFGAFLIIVALVIIILIAVITQESEIVTGTLGISIEDLADYTVPTNADIGSKVVNLALTKCGAIYSQALRWNEGFYDCSSFTYRIYKEFNIDISNDGDTTAAGEAKWCSKNGYVVDYEDLAPGDLIFYSFGGQPKRFMGIDHVAIYCGEGKVVDASSSRGKVVFRNIYSIDQIAMCGRPSASVSYMLTGYCPCIICCGKWSNPDNPHTASGTVPIPNHTIAADTSIYPFGTQIKINGITYTVEDTGSKVSGYHFDIYFNTHQEALAFGLQKTNDVEVISTPVASQ